MNWSDLTAGAMAMAAFVLLFLLGGFVLFVTIGAKAERAGRHVPREGDEPPEETS